MTHGIQLYPDQEDLLNRTRAAMGRHKSVLIQASTGFGKTILSVEMLNRARLKGTTSMFIVPRRELLKQTAKTMDTYGIPYGIVAAGYTGNPFAKVHLATSGTLARRLDMAPKAQLVMVDETHYGEGQLESIIRHYQGQGSWVIGLSATPWKMSGKGLGVWYDHMECGPSSRQLMDDGRLSDYRLFAPNKPDLSGIKVTAGDYSKGQLSEYMEQDRVLIGNAVKHYRDHAMGRLNVAFCTSIKHAEIVAQMFRDGGIPAAHVSGAMDDTEIARIVRSFARREILVLANCDLLTFGFDLASAAGMDVTVESMSDLRPTKSVSLQLQKWGRVLRAKEYPALIFDHAGNIGEHGLPDEERQWSLEGRPKQGRIGAQKTEPVRQCPVCYFVHRPCPVCPNCGAVYPIQSRMLDEVDGDLREVDKSSERKLERSKHGMAETLDDLIRMGKLKGMKNPAGWAAHVMSARMAKRNVK